MGRKDTKAETEELKRISKLIRDGNHMGHDPFWSIEVEAGVLEDEDALEEIARLVEGGYREGFHPRWTLKRD